MPRIIRTLFFPLLLLATLLMAVISAPAHASGGGASGPGVADGSAALHAITVRAAVRKAAVPAQAYTVRPGDTLSAIAARYLGGAGNWPRLYGANVKVIGADPDVILPGQVLVLELGPASYGSQPAAPAPAQAATDDDGDSDGGTSDSPVQAPAQAQAPVQQQSQQVNPASYSGFQQCVISRESGGNAQVMNSTGHYGLYQFSASTWAAYGGNPADFGNASVGEQNQVFANAMAQGGEGNWSPYDGC